MSQTTVRKEVADRLLKSLSKENNPIIRKAIETGGRPQIIQLRDLNFIKDTIGRNFIH